MGLSPASKQGRRTFQPHTRQSSVMDAPWPPQGIISWARQSSAAGNGSTGLVKGIWMGTPPPNTHISIYYEQQRQKWRSKHKIFMEQSEQGRRIGKDVKYSITSGMSRLKRRIQKPFLGGNVHPKVDFPPFRYNIFWMWPIRRFDCFFSGTDFIAAIHLYSTTTTHRTFLECWGFK